MDKETRNLLAKITQASRSLLEAEFAEQLEGTFDIFDDGRIAEEPGATLTAAQRFARNKIIQAIEIRRSKNESAAESVRAFLRECAFTFLNRIAALKMMEARDITQECVSKGNESRGFKEFGGLAPGLVALPDRGYQLYLESLFDEVSREVGVLFDRSDPNSLLWPRRKALESLLETINDPGLASSWAEDEAIGWLYQYFNSSEERKKMREESAAPRNSRELAVRNQFFTPRYVVEFLTDNTLGRIWYEMVQGRTRLKDECRYLVRRPTEIFLAPGESAPEVGSGQKAEGSNEEAENLTQEELLKQPVYVPHRPMKDPREIRLLDPACGSMHFGLYAFDLFETIYAEAWERQLSVVGGRWSEDTHEQAKILSGLAGLAEGDGSGRSDLPGDQGLSEGGTLRAEQSNPPGSHLDPVEHRGGAGSKLYEGVPSPSGDSLRLTDGDGDPDSDLSASRVCESPRSRIADQPSIRNRQDVERAFRRALEKANWTLTTDHRPLLLDYPTHDELLKAVPKLIIEHNIHGVDIDPRAVQIAGLSLWLRAQKTWKDTPAAGRPRVRRSNIVCAEPMPGSDAMLEDFVQTLDPPLLGELVKTVFDKMQLAGEAGTLLKIEEEIRTAIDDAKAKWEKLGAAERDLFSAEELNQTLRPGAQQELTGVEKALTTDHRPLATDFFDTAEERIYAALRDYAESAEAGDYQRRLFAEDAAHGFAFIDLCRRRYDAVVMNPPFGDPSRDTKEYLSTHYIAGKYDILAAFVDRGRALLNPEGFLGCICSRTVFFIEFFKAWRSNLIDHASILQFADLGSKVLEALVETAAFTLRNSSSSPPAFFVRLLSVLDKDERLLDEICNLRRSRPLQSSYIRNPAEFEAISGAPIAYWVPRTFIHQFEKQDLLQRAVGEVRVGLQTGYDFRFVRTAWEVLPKLVGESKFWSPLAKGGEFHKFYDDIHLLVNWAGQGAEIINFVDEKGKQRSRPQNTACYYRAGLTYPMRTASNYSPRVLPAGCVFNVQGNSIFVEDDDAERLLAVLGVISTAAFESFTRLKARVGDMTTAEGAGFTYTPGLIGTMPFPALEESAASKLTSLSGSCVKVEMQKDLHNETSRLFLAPSAALLGARTLRDSFALRASNLEELDLEELTAVEEIEELVQTAYGFSDEDRLEVIGQFGLPAASYPPDAESKSDILYEIYHRGLSDPTLDSSIDGTQQRQLPPDRHLNLEEICRVARIAPESFVSLRRENGWIRSDELIESACELIQYLTGCPLGRWDIRYATGERQPPELPDPFDPLPVCPPGMLQNADGLPAAPSDVPDDYPLRITWPGIFVSDPGHPEDIVARVRDALAVIWGDRSAAIEQEACEILGVRTLRDYFAEKKSGGKFFKDHLKRYSKSRRQAPIYWPLSTESGTYTLWIYYHRLTSDTLFNALRDFVQPRRQTEELFFSRTQDEARDNPSTEIRKKLASSEDLLTCLRSLETELKRVAPLFNPNLNDGVIINYAPLWRMIQDTGWQKKCKECWGKLAKGDYDWAHLAMHLWPERVVPKCGKDRSLAIAHGLEDEFWFEDGDDKGKWKQRKVDAVRVEELIAERTSAAVKAALEDLLSAHAPSGTKRSKKRT